ncbi:unnamed protein product [Paramecium primaurelia]|uniref:Calcium-dependent protein kinase 1 n=1 Tax=Paramecium primaurelia TaxID=5886 RepID=A0A8S1NBH5_PARPR|nr:unnamed protein product [Paramecium primaurelia]
MGVCSSNPKRKYASTRGSQSTFYKTQEVSTIKSNKSLKKQRTNFKVAPNIFISLKSGSILSYYKVQSTLGEGTYGRVSLVIQKSTQILRAMKQIAKDKILVSQRDKMIQEVNILKNLDHPNIVNIYELYQDEHQYYLITEYLSGGELFQRVQQRNNFNEKVAANYMKQILSAVNYCHQRNIVHRDLKPENILFDSKTSDDCLKIIDFGTAKQLEQNSQLKQKIGTPYFIAPEVIDQNYNNKCDIWSCGVILYTLMSGKPPFNGNNLNDLYKNIKQGQVDFNGTEWKDVSEEAKSFILKMLTVDPTKRISAEFGLKDPWIVNNQKIEKINPRNLQNLESFHNKSKLSSAILQLISTQIMNSKEKKELIEGFKAIDKNGDGKLSKEELISCYMNLYQDEIKCSQIVDKIFRSADLDHSGTIDYTEFIIGYTEMQNLMAKEKLETAFKLFDKDGNGIITKQELKEILGGLDLEDKQWESVFLELDTNGDGEVSFQEFTQLLLKDTKQNK